MRQLLWRRGGFMPPYGEVNSRYRIELAHYRARFS